MTVGSFTDFESAMRVLVDYSILDVQLMSRVYSMHICVHNCTLAGLNKTVDAQSYLYAFDCVAKSMRGVEWKSLEHLRHA